MEDTTPKQRTKKIEEMLKILVDSYDDDDSLKLGVFYEIKHAYLPPNAPDKLKATHIVKVALKNLTSKKVLICYTDADSVRAFLNPPEIPPYMNPEEEPDMDEEFLIENRVALKLLFREIPEEEYNRRKHSVDFWLV